MLPAMTSAAFALAWCWRHFASATIVTSSRLTLDMLLNNAGLDLRSRRLCRGIYRQLIDIDGEIVIRPREENLAYSAVRFPTHYYRTDPVSGLVQLVNGVNQGNDIASFDSSILGAT